MVNGDYDTAVSISVANKMFPKRHPNIARKFYPLEQSKQINRLQSISTQARGMLELKSPFTPPEIISSKQQQELESPKWNPSKHEIGVGPENTNYGAFKISDKSPLQKLLLDSTVNRNEALNLKSGVANYHGKSLSLSVNYRGGK